MICGNKEELKDLYNAGEECVNDVVHNGYFIEFTNHTMYCGEKEKLVNEATTRGNQLVVVRELICNDKKTKVYKALGITLSEFFNNLLDEVNTVVQYNNGLGALVGGTQVYTVYVGYNGVVHVVKNYELPERFRNKQMVVPCCSTWLGRKSGKRLEYYYMGNKVDIVGIVMETAKEFNGKTNLSSLFSLVTHKINKLIIEEPMELLQQKERAKAKKEQEEKEKAAEKERIALLRTRADKFSSLDMPAVEMNNPFVRYRDLLNKEEITIDDLEKSDLIADNSISDKYLYKGNHIIISNDLLTLMTELKNVMNYNDLAVIKSEIQDNYWVCDLTKANVVIYGTRKELVRFLCEHIKYDILNGKHVRFKNDQNAIAVNIQNRIGLYKKSVHTPELNRYDEKKYRVPYELGYEYRWLTLIERYGLRKFRINHCIGNEITRSADRISSKGYSISIDEFGYMLLDRMDAYISGANSAYPFFRAMNGMVPVLPFYYGKEPKVKIGKSRIDIEISIVSKYAKQEFIKEHWKEISEDLVKRIESRKNFQNLGVPMNFWKIGKAIIRNDDVLDVCFDLKLRDNEDL